MKQQDIIGIINAKRPCNIFVSDGRIIYIDHPEIVMVSEDVTIIGLHTQGAPLVAGSGAVAVRAWAGIANDQITGIEPSQARPLRETA